jgi:hypothetical protein
VSENSEYAPEASPAIPVVEFEGAYVTQMEGRLPSISLEMDEGYKRGTILRLQVEVRVKNVRYEEGRNGELTRQHVFALDGVQLVAAFSPEEANDAVGGSASGQPTPTPEEVAELGLPIGRTGDQWGVGF